MNRTALPLLAVLAVAAAACSSSPSDTVDAREATNATDADLFGLHPKNPTLLARAVVPVATFTKGPTSGQELGVAPINGITPPFVNQQPFQGISALLDAGRGRFYAMPDNGFGSIENSADFRLRVYTIRPDLAPRRDSGAVRIEGFFELRDPDKQIPFAIVEEFTDERFLTGADFDIESMQRDADGTFWFGDELGPFLLHTDASGKVLEAPIALPDPDAAAKGPDGEPLDVHAPQNPFSEESSALRVMNAFRHHARLHGSTKTPVISPYHVLLADGDGATLTGDRETVPAGSGLAKASSEIFDVKSLKTAGYPVVPYTINDAARMSQLLALGVDGIISDRSDLLFATVAAYDANGDGVPGDYLDADGLVDIRKVDIQGHRGSRDLRPENTLPAFEAGLDNLVTTLELDIGITKDGVAVIDHDPHVQSQKCRRADGTTYDKDEVLVRDLTVAQLQTSFVCDKVFRGASQQNARALSPVSVGYAATNGIADPYAMPSLEQLFGLVDAYVAYYTTGEGKAHPLAAKRAKNAARVRFNIETKVNPRAEYAARTIDAAPFADTVASLIALHGYEDRADIQSFDFRTLLEVQAKFPKIRTVYLFGDFPIYANPAIAGSDDGTNLQPDETGNTPWMAGLRWPYRQTALTHPFRSQTSGGFEGMALSKDGRYLLPLLEKPLTGAPAKTLEIFSFDLWTHRYTGRRARYVLDEKSVSIGDFQMVSKNKGYVIERDGTQGDLTGLKRVYEIELGAAGEVVTKTLALDLMSLADPRRISVPGSQAGDVGVGQTFAFPFTTIESIVPMGNGRFVLCNDNNFPFSVGRHVGTGAPDDTEVILVDVGRK